MEKQVVLMQGNEACVMGAIDAGMRFFAGYPITPSTEIAETAAVRLPQVGGRFIQMEDEISSMAAVIGASAAGVKSMTASSGPGISLKQENIGYAAMTELPCVIVDVQRAGPSTGSPTMPSQGDVMQARWGTHGDHPIIVVSPSSVPETYYETIRCFNLSEAYCVPVILLMDEMVAHMREGFELPDRSGLKIVNRRTVSPDDTDWRPYAGDERGVPALPPFGTGRRYHITGLCHDERGYPTGDTQTIDRMCRRLMDKIERNRDDIITYEDDTAGADTAVVCFGGTARSARRAVRMAREKGAKAGLFRLITIWPFPQREIEALAQRVKRIIVVEHNDGQILHEVERVVQGRCKVDFIGRINGTIIMPGEIEQAIMEGQHE